MRLHSDRAGELRSKAIRKWAEDRKVLRTYTDGDAFKSNGKVQAEVGMLKEQIRTLLKESGEEAQLWPLAARHAAETRLRSLTFGQEGYATQKIWNEKWQDWKMLVTAEAPPEEAHQKDPAETQGIQRVQRAREDLDEDPWKDPHAEQSSGASVEEAEERRLGGVKLLMEELGLRSELTERRHHG